ncbi:MAG: DUF2313 domain-containing protein [Alphaproteobacteria bacterium]|nr:DUF2313 domain-containing protein [Alphaproteobacteria bacterium]
MPLPSYSADDFKSVLQARLPRGRAWPRDADSVMAQVVGAYAPTNQRVCARAAQLLQDAFPVAPVELLPEWEQTLGLPDPYTTQEPSTAQRQAQVATRFAATGGQSIDYIINYAAKLGYTITITQFAPMRAGQPCGQPVYGQDWIYAWQINGPTYTVVPAKAGVAVCGDPLASWTNDILQYELKRIAPAHTQILFVYN